MSGQRVKINWHVDPLNVLRYGYCPSQEAWERERQRVLRTAHVEIGRERPTTPGMTTSWKEADGSPACLVSLDTSLDQVKLVGTLAHESYHVACAIAEAMSDNSPSEEFMAYITGYVAQNIMRDYLSAPACGGRVSGAMPHTSRK